jgi:Ni,Fe-hydrogenase maturation factor
MAGKTLILGLGNRILTDDGVGIHVARAVAAAIPQAVEMILACIQGDREL